MTINELERAIKVKKRRQETQEKKQAVNDYILADLIGRSVSRCFNSNNKMPAIAEAYPSLFDSEEIEEAKQQKQMELSALRFKQFADTFNKNFLGGGKQK